MYDIPYIIKGQRCCPLYQLPAELLLNIIDRLDLIDFPSLLCATLPLLRYHHIVPHTSRRELSAMIRAVSHGRYRPQYPLQSNGNPPGLRSLPTELRMQMGRYLTTADKVNFTIAAWRLFCTLSIP